ncbi:hypothetical protein [Cellulomonas sp. ICMP 17802]|uniref:hypothetical protein n=1 Tax=Cellulomonas sp. ICMP 17802 TaxID=3239199 RepID=UPI00351B16A0
MTTEVAERPSLLRRAVKPVVMLVIGFFAWQVGTALVGAVDWAAVLDAFGHLTWWMALPLLAALLLRQLCNAVPLRRYVLGLGVGRSMANDLTANLVATAAPPPADIVLRVAMFRSWGLDPVMGMAGVTLNTVKFYAVRFLAPVLGLLLVASQGVERRQWVVALLCGLVAAVMLGSLLLLVRGDHLAIWLGRTAGRVVRRFRPSVDPAAWADALVEIRARSADSLRTGLATSMLALVAMVLADALILLLALRFTGVDAGALSVVDIVGGFLLVYPLTLLPLFGFGVLDALLLGAWVTAAGVLYEPDRGRAAGLARGDDLRDARARAGDAGVVALAVPGGVTSRPRCHGDTVRGRARRGETPCPRCSDLCGRTSSSWSARPNPRAWTGWTRTPCSSCTRGSGERGPSTPSCTAARPPPAWRTSVGAARPARRTVATPTRPRSSRRRSRA